MRVREDRGHRHHQAGVLGHHVRQGALAGANARVPRQQGGQAEFVFFSCFSVEGGHNSV